MNEEEKKYVGYYDKGGQYIPAEDVPPLVLPRELFQTAKAMASMEGDELEAQLKTFDALLPTLPGTARSQMASLLSTTSDQATKLKTKLRLRKAFISLNAGETICKP